MFIETLSNTNDTIHVTRLNKRMVWLEVNGHCIADNESYLSSIEEEMEDGQFDSSLHDELTKLNVDIKETAFTIVNLLSKAKEKGWI